MSNQAGRSGDVERYLRTRFLERIAHDLRGPVGVTSGALDELEIALESKTSDAERTLFLMARRGLKKLLRIADRLGRAAQLEAGSLALHSTDLDLGKLLASSVEEAQLLEGRRGIAVELAGHDGGCPVRLDADWLGVVLIELVGNAIRHAKRKVKVGLQHDGDACSITIEDDGFGMASQPSERFTPSDEPRGLGLALSIASDVVAAHGGRLTLDSARLSGAERQGTLVTLHLPKVHRQPTPAER